MRSTVKKKIPLAKGVDAAPMPGAAPKSPMKIAKSEVSPAGMKKMSRKKRKAVFNAIAHEAF